MNKQDRNPSSPSGERIVGSTTLCLGGIKFNFRATGLCKLAFSSKPFKVPYRPSSVETAGLFQPFLYGGELMAVTAPCELKPHHPSKALQNWANLKLS